jgi:type III pantothenate kinase
MICGEHGEPAVHSEFPQNIKQQVVHIAEQLWPAVSVQEIYTQKYALGVRNAYPKHNKLGVDRWLAMLAAYHYYNAPVCIVSCGSALTLDIVDSQGSVNGCFQFKLVS